MDSLSKNNSTDQSNLFLKANNESQAYYADFLKELPNNPQARNVLVQELNKCNLTFEPDYFCKSVSICLPKIAVDAAISNLGLELKNCARSASKLESLVAQGFDLFALINHKGEIEYATWTNNPNSFDNWIESLNQTFPIRFEVDGSIYRMSDIMADLSLIKLLKRPIVGKVSNFYDFNVANSVAEDKLEITYVANESDRQCPYCADCDKYASKTCNGKLCNNGYAVKHIKEYAGYPVSVKINFTQLIKPKGCDRHINGLKFERFVSPMAKVTWNLIYALLEHHNVSPSIAAAESAKLFGIDEELVKALLNCHYLCKLHKTQLPKCERLIIDEFLADDGYITIAVDNDVGKPVCLFKGRRKDQIMSMFQHLKQNGSEVKIIASDDHAPFRSAAFEIFGRENIVWVLDNFHAQYKLVLEHLVPRTNAVKTLDGKLLKDPNREEYAPGVAEHVSQYKGKEKEIFSRLSLLLRYTRDREHLKSKNISQEQFDYINNHPILGTMLDIRSGLSDVFKSQTVEKGAAALDLLTTKVQSLIAMNPEIMGSFKRFYNTLVEKRDGILAYIQTKLTSSKIEGFNCKIKLLKRSQRGVKNPFSFMLRCMFSF